MLPTVRRHRTLPGLFLNDFLNENTWNSLFEADKKYSNSNKPAVNVEETEKEYVISLAAPGLDKKDFHITVDKNILTIAASNENKKDEEQNNYLRREFNYQSFSRSFSLPENTELNKIKASHKNGVLNIHVAKEEVKVQKAKEISIN